MKYPFISQSGLKDCGVCSLLMIMKYYGGGSSLEYLREQTNTTKDGVSLYGLSEGAKKIGFLTKGVNGDIENLSDEEFPLIAHVIKEEKYQHFIVIYKINYKKNYLIIGDPANKKITRITIDEFKRISTKNYLLLYPNKKIPLIKENNYIVEFLKRFVSEHKSYFSLIFIYQLVITLFEIVLSFKFQMLIDYIIPNYNNNYTKYIIIFGTFILFNSIIKYYREKIINYISNLINHDLLENVYDRLLSLPYYYYKNRTTGEVIARINDLNNIKDLLCKCLITCFIDLLLAFSTFIIILKISTELSILVLLLVFISFIFIIISYFIIKTPIYKLKSINSEISNTLVESISGIETIKNFNLENYSKYELERNNYLLEKENYKFNNVFNLISSYKSFFEELLMMIIIVYGSYLINNGTLTISSLITFYFLISYLIEPLRSTFELILSYRDSKISIRRINELFEYSVNNEDGKLILDNSIFSIEIKNLYFAYAPNKKIIDKLSMKINNKDRVLLYGKSGSGKSTLAKIIARIIPYENGSIKINNYELNLYDKKELNKKICYLSQNEILFQKTVYENICLDSKINYKKFLDICKICMVDQIVENNPLKYNMLLEENGFNISGGERQRILLARALVRNCDLYILDESLSQIDIDREKMILEKVFNKYKNKTFIVISHRFSSMNLFNKVKNMNQGEKNET